ncbi:MULTISPECIES: ubiquinol-cytochrome c reductase iron-sulfur subunit N-terminal domain-containing protein [Malaciobacter]|jgi:ubiquinol-cytochrome c reductase iron-sulfur subunit|uniref:Ubiquinol cytochrome c oxidoreductase PetABC, [2Fe-2S] subunit n=2 Tax=Malaciobacter TaxID=2321114 RepID=A0A1T5BSS7_9BACT|nr:MULTISPECIES: ubiquinol-cytochrome c reductase iron-sulfur subunit N-terminal domain-containing protein [Malaciobacter]AXX86161.1 ubiquinol cytochrome c oxidoreductase PetABC [2Fe-2S] subunit [Malaciobacter marinus]PHO10483.1 ubiquinol-cytochrome c reductase iron-sulfur subunit [Malaciobacter canalis]PHO13502.1 ubiquinol-cytochrome c reductase iron-sulfur subunit [Malaciobacter marinus]PHO14529.1 ubiquinol-cytochrome c reductase iron-sulfur subunit [Malaciobacter marinus]PPK61042.1 ubiquino
MSNETNRRDFLGYTFAAVAAVGGAASLVGMKKAWDPLPSVLASGFTEFDLSKSKAGEPSTIMWRGKPIFILKKTAEMEDSKRDLVVNGDRFTIAIGLCTHLGCIPAWKKDMWKCACHGGEFNASGKQTFGPPPRPLDLPPFSVSGNTLTLGEEGPEYKEIAAAMMA